MNHFIFLSIFLSFMSIFLLLGYIGSRGVKSYVDYFLAGRRLGIFPLTLTLVATQIGGGFIIGTAQESYRVGYFGILYSFGIALGLLFLGLGIASKMHALGYYTTSEVFEKKYNAPLLNILSSLFSIATLFGVIIGQIVATRLLLNFLGFEYEILVVIFWLIIIAYTVWGGLQSVVFTDSFQALFILIFFITVFLYLLFLEGGLYDSMKSVFLWQPLFTSVSFSTYDIERVVLMPALFCLIGQDVGQRIFSAKTKFVVIVSTLLSFFIILLFSVVPVYLGMKAKMLSLDFVSPSLSLIRHLMSETVFILGACAILAAITSTGDSLLIAISSQVSGLLKVNNIERGARLYISKIITFVVGLFAIIFSYFIPQNVIRIIVGSYELSVCCLFVPLVIGYFRDNLNKYAAICSILCGLLGYIGFKFYPMMPLKGVITLVFSLFGYFIGDLLIRKAQ